MARVRRQRSPRIQQQARRSRRGVAAVELAFVGPIALLFIMAIIVGGIGAFRAHQITGLAAEAARWASVEGLKHARSRGAERPTVDDVMSEAIAPLSASLDLERLECSLDWDERSSCVTIALEYPWSSAVLGKNLRSRAICRMPVSQ